MNTLRVFQWLSGKENQSAFLGGIGMDDNSQVLDDLVKKDGVITAFSWNKCHPTGHCIALVEGEERTLCARLGAAEHYSCEDLWSQSNKEHLENAKVVYIEGYFLFHSFEAVMEVANYTKSMNIPLMINLSGEYVCKDVAYVKNVIKLLPYVNFIFGNASEFNVFLETVKEKLEVRPTVIDNLLRQIDPARTDAENEIQTSAVDTNLKAIVTDGSNPVTCFSLATPIQTFSVDVPCMSKDLIKVLFEAFEKF